MMPYNISIEQLIILSSLNFDIHQNTLHSAYLPKRYHTILENILLNMKNIPYVFTSTIQIQGIRSEYIFATIGWCPGMDEWEHLKALAREASELRQANGILRRARACFARAALDAINGSAVDPAPPGSRCLRHRQGPRSSTRSAGFTGSCRSPRRPATPMLCGLSTQANGRRG